MVALELFKDRRRKKRILMTEIDVLANEIAEKLTGIKEKEELVVSHLTEIDGHNKAIKELTDKVQKLKQEIAGERYVIAEKLGKPKDEKQ